MTYIAIDEPVARSSHSHIKVTGQEVLALAVAVIMALGPLTAYATGFGA